MTDLCFFPSHLNFSCPHERLAYQILKLNLELDTQIFSEKQHFNSSLLSAVFLKKDEVLLDKARTLFQIGLTHLITEFNRNTSFDLIRKQDFLNRVLCLVPYLEFPEGSQITMPYYHHKGQRNLETGIFESTSHWRSETFSVSKIRLTEPSIWLNPYDKVFAYGLHHSNQSKLIFSGTTYPAGEGFFSHIMTDLDGFHSVGETLLASGRANILKWMKDKNIDKVTALGTSLGGSMALLWSEEQADITSDVFAFNPPGLLNLPKKSQDPTPSNSYDGAEIAESLFMPNRVGLDVQMPIPTRILIQEHDRVSQFGFWHPDWTIIKVSAPQDKFFHHSLFAHALTFVGKDESKYEELNIDEENQNRFWRNLLVFRILRSLVYLSILLPVYYVVKPLWRLIYQELFWIAISSALLLTILSTNPLLCVLVGFALKEILNYPHQMENLYYITLSLLSLASYFFLAQSLPILLLPIAFYLFTQIFANLFNDEPKASITATLS